MSRADIIASLRERASDIKEFGATSLYLFGSAARNEATEHSDVDLFVDYDPECFTFVELMRLRTRLSEILGRPADLTTREGLHPLLRPVFTSRLTGVISSYGVRSSAASRSFLSPAGTFRRNSNLNTRTIRGMKSQALATC
jgi:predicted nucleotidyltransferase